MIRIIVVHAAMYVLLNRVQPGVRVIILHHALKPAAEQERAQHTPALLAHAVHLSNCKQTQLDATEVQMARFAVRNHAARVRITQFVQTREARYVQHLFVPAVFVPVEPHKE